MTADEEDSIPSGLAGRPISAPDGITAEVAPHEPPRVEVIFVATEEKRLLAIRHSARDLVGKILGTKTGDEIWNLREAVWPALGLPEFRDLEIASVKLTLLPLSRIGQMEGKSGSLVLIGFLFAEGMGLPHSHPLVVKTLDRSKSDKLAEEYRNALSIKPFAYDSKDSFAIPIHFDDRQDGYKILWSICSLSGDIWRGATDPASHTPIFEVSDLRTPLIQGQVEVAERTLESVFNLLRNCHTRLGTARREERPFGLEYAWYLRGLGTVWGREWEELWGTAAEDRIVGGGDSDVNPLWLIERLRFERREMYVGAVHGDLHPGNVVLSRGGQPAIIDFGWALDRAHVAKDFVLMECNLRFLTLKPQVRPAEIDAFEDWIAWGSPPPPGLGEYLDGRIKLILLLRAKAAQVFPEDTDWGREYIVPLFFVAFGLLRFAPQLGNQQAAIRFVLSLARHIGGQSRSKP